MPSLVPILLVACALALVRTCMLQVDLSGARYWKSKTLNPSS